MHNFDCVIFDIDGTIVSTFQLIFDSLNFVSNKYIGKTFTNNELIEMFGPPEEVILKKLFNGNFKQAEIDYFDFYSKMHLTKAILFPEMKSIIKHVKKSGAHLAVFTGKGKRSTEITLKKIGLSEYFPLVITGDDVKTYKPSGEGIEKIVEYFGVDKSRTLMIGDSTHDIIASKSAGVKVASVLWDSYSKEEIMKLDPDFICPDINSLKIFLQDNL